jgi:hypothetical protein
MYYHRENQSQYINKKVTFPSIYLLAGIIAVAPPFSVVLTDWLSIIAALG